MKALSYHFEIGRRLTFFRAREKDSTVVFPRNVTLLLFKIHLKKVINDKSAQCQEEMKNIYNVL